MSLDSEPVQPTLSSQICPVPSPNAARLCASAPTTRIYNDNAKCNSFPVSHNIISSPGEGYLKCEMP